MRVVTATRWSPPWARAHPPSAGAQRTAAASVVPQMPAYRPRLDGGAILFRMSVAATKATISPGTASATAAP